MEQRGALEFRLFVASLRLARATGAPLGRHRGYGVSCVVVPP